MEPQRKRISGERLTLRLRKSRDSGGSQRVKVVEPRGTHFKKTLVLAGALCLFVFCIYLFTHTASVQANNGTNESAAQGASSARP